MSELLELLLILLTIYGGYRLGSDQNIRKIYVNILLIEFLIILPMLNFSTSISILLYLITLWIISIIDIIIKLIK